MPDTLEQQLKAKLVEVLELEVKPEEIGDTQPLFGDASLGLDSVDLLEVVAMLQADFDAQIPSREEAIPILANVRSMADFIRTKA